MNRCTACNAPLAHDQRYCVECGTRRGPLPHYVTGLIAGIHEQGRNEVPVRLAPPDTSASTAGSGSNWVVSLRVATLLVMAMLAFGAEIGAATGSTGLSTLASAPLLVLKMVAPAAPSTTTTTTVVSAASAPAPPASAPATSSSGGSVPSSAPASGGSTSPTPTVPANTSTPATSNNSGNPNPFGLPSIKHVFVVMLADQGYSQTFGSTDSYLAKALPKQGKLITFYYAVAGGELANQIAVVSGQGPTDQTEANCPQFTNIVPGKTGKHNQVLGQGCVYPRSTQTLGNQLTAAHLSWKAYIQGMDTGQPGQPSTCRHPAPGTADQEGVPQTGDPYVTWRNPFVYFRSLTATKACNKEDVDLSQLSTDLTQESTTPSLSYIVPNACDDGSDQPCTPGATSGVLGADAFLRTLIPEIKNSIAYQEGGLIMISFDQAPQTGPYADPSSCCATPKYPNLTGTSTSPPTATSTTPTATTPTTTTTTPTSTTTTTTTAPTTTTSTTTTTTTTAPTTTTSTTTTTTTTTTTPPPTSGGQGQVNPTGGGGQVGMLLISPWIKPGTIDPIDYYNHYSLLASIEDIFNLKHLGYANQKDLPKLDAGTFDGKGPSGG